MAPDNSKKRLDWVDAGKGLAIILMVLGHIVGGLLFLQILPRPADFQAFYTWIYTFHMATLMLLSGLFLEQSISKGAKSFILGRLGSLYYPSILWGVITYAATYPFAGFINHPLQASGMLPLLYSPQSSAWFLTTLLEVSIAFLIMRRVGIPVPIIAAIAMGSFAWGGHYDLSLAKHFGWWGLFLVLGTLVRQPLLQAFERAKTVTLIIVSALGGLITLIYPHPAVGSSLADAAISICGVAMLVSLGMIITRPMARTWLSRLTVVAGRHSLQIYLLHSLSWVGTRIILIRVLHVPSGIATLLISWALGILVPVAAAELAIRFRLSWLFRLDFPHLVPQTA